MKKKNEHTQIGLDAIEINITGVDTNIKQTEIYHSRRNNKIGELKKAKEGYVLTLTLPKMLRGSNIAPFGLYDAIRLEETIEEIKIQLEELFQIDFDNEDAVPLAIMLDFEIGVRCGELLALKESDIISENGTSKLYIHRQVVKENNITDLENIKQIGWNVVDYTKSDCGERKIPLTPKALEYIDRIRQINVLNGNQNKGFLFLTEDGTIITRDALDGQLRRGCAYAGIPIRSMHKIRKTYASTLYQRGVSITIISKLLGHADESTTMKHYIFNLKDETETDSLVLNALSSNTITNNLITISREEISESVTDGDNKIISFAAIKKWKTPHKQRVSH